MQSPVRSKLHRPHRPLFRAAQRFARDEDGVITALACVIILMMVIVGGISVDLMHNEMERVRVQNTSDRAVLAAADLEQELDPEAVVQDYFAKSGMSDVVSGVDVSEGLNFRTVTVDASTTTQTRFMSMFGVDTLPVPGRSTAEERISNVEISLALDISGSMAYNNRMPLLKDAAKEFVETVVRPENQGRISVSLIPYSEHVNAGPDLMSRLNVNTAHNFSHCVEFDVADFADVRINRDKVYDQAQHFQWNYNGSLNDRTNTVCPRYDYERITPFSQNAVALKEQIDQLQPRAGTSIFLGMKWAAGLLDPDFNAITTDLAVDNLVDPNFANRPAAYNSEDTLKTVVLMTDGQNSSSSRIRSDYYDSASEVAHWDRSNFWWYLNNYVSYYYRSRFYFQKYTATAGDLMLANMCEVAKENNIVIWSIGFEVTDHGADVMRECASSPSHFFRVEGLEVEDAFRAIGRQINQLRLTQ